MKTDNITSKYNYVKSFGNLAYDDFQEQDTSQLNSDTLQVDEDTLQVARDTIIATDTLEYLQEDYDFDEDPDSLFISEEDDETLVAPQDTIVTEDSVQDTPEPEPQYEPEPPEVTRKQIHPDSIYTVETKPEHFEKTDTLYPLYEPAVNYLGEHQLEPQQPITIKGETESNVWAFPFLILSLFFVAVARFSFNNRLKQIIKAPYATRLFNQMEREGGILNEWITILLFFNFSLVFALLVYNTLDYFAVLESFSSYSPTTIIFIVILATICFIIVKYWILRLLGWVFKTMNMPVSYFKNNTIFNLIIGLILLPFVFTYIFNPAEIFIYSAWLIFVVANVFKITRGLIIGSNEARLPWYYIFLYLCTVEVAPLLIIAKLSVDYMKAI